MRDDLAICQLHYPPKVFRFSVLKSWFNLLWGVYGSGAGKIFYDAGVEAGKNAAKFFAERLRLEGEMFARFLAGVGSSLGWGSFTLEEFDIEKCKMKIKAEDSFECKLAGKPGESRGYFIRGYILGAAAQIFKTENLTIEEAKCVAKGDPYCEFR